MELLLCNRFSKTFVNTASYNVCHWENMEACCSVKSIVGGMCGFDTRGKKKKYKLFLYWPVYIHTASLGFSSPEYKVDLIPSWAAVFTQAANIMKNLIWAGGGDLLQGVECQRHYPIMTEEAKSGRAVTEESGKLIHK